MEYRHENSEYFWNEHVRENIQLFIYSALCLFVPFFLGHSQFLVGTIVNASIILASLRYKGYKLLPVILLPSIGLFARNIVFGAFTPFLLYMIPFIWLGNFALAFIFRKLYSRKNKSRLSALPIAAITKTSLLFLSAFFLFKLSAIPAIFLSSMGMMQFYTAMTGGIVALAAAKITGTIRH